MNVAANTAQLQTDVNRIQGSLDSVGGMASKLGSLMAGAFTVTAISSAANRILDYAGKLSDLSAKTGLSTGALEEMNHAAKLTGTTLDTFANAAFKLGVNIAGGGDSVYSSLNKLGLSYEAIRRMSPDEQFNTIAVALGHVKNEQDRNKIAVELFGKAAKDILPAIAQGYDQIAASAMKSGDDQIKALDIAGDALQSFWDGFLAVGTRVLGGFVIIFRETFRTMSDAFGTVFSPITAAFKALGTAMEAAGLKGHELPKVLNASSAAAKNLPEPLRAASVSTEEQERRMKALEVAHKGTTASTRGLSTAQVEVDENIQRLTDSFTRQIDAFKRTNTIQNTVYDGFKLLRVEFTETIPVLQNLTASGFDPFKSAVTQTGHESAKTADAIHTLAAGFAQLGQITGGRSGSLVTGIGQIISGLSTAQKVAGESGGRFGLFSAALDKSKTSSDRLTAGITAGISVAQGAINVWNAAGNSATRMGGAFNGAMSGAAAGAMFGPWGAAIGAVGGAIIGLFRGGANAAKEAAAKIAQQNAELIATLKSQLAGFQSDLEGLIARGAELGYVFNQQGDIIGLKFDKLRDTAQKYGIDLAALGPAFQGHQIHEAAQTIIDDFWLLVQGGADVGTVLLAMSPQINQLVQDSIRLGTTIPENMRPWLQSLLDAGLLVDANGNKLTDLSLIQFGDPVGAQFKTIQSAIMELIKKINDLISRIASIPDNKTFTVTQRTNHEDYYYSKTVDSPDWGGNQARGGDYFVTRPTLFLAGEAGPERAMFSGAGRSSMGGDGAIDEVKRLIRDLPRAMKVAVSDAMVLQGAR